MQSFTIRLAGFSIGILAQYPSTQPFFRGYLCSDTPAFTLAVTPAHIAYEREQARLQDEADGLAPRFFPDAYLETQSILRQASDELLERDVLLFHGACLAVDGRGYMFTAPSGTGKTTHARLWLRLLPQAHMLNGDKPFLKLTADGQVFVCGNPWQGKENLGQNETLPLQAICVLRRGETNRVEEAGFATLFGDLLPQAYRPGKPEGLLKTLALLGRIGQGVKLYQLWCNMDPEAAQVSSEVMLKG